MRGEKKSLDLKTLIWLLQLGGRFSVHSLLQDQAIRERAETIARNIRNTDVSRNTIYRMIAERAVLAGSVSAACRSLEAEGVHERMGWEPGYLRQIYYGFRKASPREAADIDKIAAAKVNLRQQYQALAQQAFEDGDPEREREYDELADRLNL